MEPEFSLFTAPLERTIAPVDIYMGAPLLYNNCDWIYSGQKNPKEYIKSIRDFFIITDKLYLVLHTIFS